SVNTPKFYEYSQREKTEKFKQEYKKRACHECKNGEMKIPDILFSKQIWVIMVINECYLEKLWVFKEKAA
ncbi:MAG TPA: hypothetical protein VIL89_02705, partial [Clostridia bacterium]